MIDWNIFTQIWLPIMFLLIDWFVDKLLWLSTSELEQEKHVSWACWQSLDKNNLNWWTSDRYNIQPNVQNSTAQFTKCLQGTNEPSTLAKH